MTIPTSDDAERKVEIDVGKMVPLGLIPLVFMLILYLVATNKTNKITSQLKASVDSSRTEVKDLSGSVSDLEITVDSLVKGNKAVIKLACDKFDPRSVRLTDLKCPQ